MSASRRKGTAFESAVVAWLRANGFPAAERRALAGALDRGDIAGVTGWAIECKATRTIDLAAAIDEARVEAANAGVDRYVAVIKRRGKPVGQAYVVMPLENFGDLLKEGLTAADNCG